MRLRLARDLKDQANLRKGTIGYLKPDPLQGEGTEEEVREAKAAEMRQRRIRAARASRWTELPAVEPHGKYLVAEGMLYKPVRAEVWSGGNPQVELNGHLVDAFVI